MTRPASHSSRADTLGPGVARREELFQRVLDVVNVAGTDGSGDYLVDKEIGEPEEK